MSASLVYSLSSFAIERLLAVVDDIQRLMGAVVCGLI
jgi:hypothetical protein